MAIIYALENKLTGKSYIGCTSGNMAKRLREHRCLLRKGIHKVKELQNDWKKDGESNFVIKRLEEFDNTENVIFKRVRELYWMQEFSIKGKLYNEHQISFSPTSEVIKKGVAASARSDFRKSDSFLEVRKEVIKRTILTPENKQGNKDRQLNRWQNPEYRAKMLEALDRGRRNRVK